MGAPDFQQTVHPLPNTVAKFHQEFNSSIVFRSKNGKSFSIDMQNMHVDAEGIHIGEMAGILLESVEHLLTERKQKIEALRSKFESAIYSEDERRRDGSPAFHAEPVEISDLYELFKEIHPCQK